MLGVPYGVLWGVATAFAALLPVGGTAIVSIPASIYLFLEGETATGFLLLGWCIGFVVMIDSVLKSIGTRLQLPMPVFFWILGGLAVCRALELILRPVLFALLAALLDLYTEEYGTAKENQRD